MSSFPKMEAAGQSMIRMQIAWPITVALPFTGDFPTLGPWLSTSFSLAKRQRGLEKSLGGFFCHVE
jgi:hypothetical protein